MGKGDKKTRRGKIFRGSFGKYRLKAKKVKATARKAGKITPHTKAGATNKASTTAKKSGNKKSH
jgi:30S ribosomal protein S31